MTSIDSALPCCANTVDLHDYPRFAGRGGFATASIVLGSASTAAFATAGLGNPAGPS